MSEHVQIEKYSKMWLVVTNSLAFDLGHAQKRLESAIEFFDNDPTEANGDHMFYWKNQFDQISKALNFMLEGADSTDESA